LRAAAAGNDGHIAAAQPDRFAGAWPAHVDCVPEARHAVVGWLRDALTPDPPLNDIGLAVSEAVTNAVTHAYVDRAPGEVRVEAEIGRDELELVVEDDGGGMIPRPDSPGLGLGLPLIATLSDRFDTRSAPGEGTRVCMWFPRV
jgi:serine/threonine-protein kinase RsbW